MVMKQAPNYSDKRGEEFVAWLIEELNSNPQADVPRLIERKQTGN